jgi:hypothetical protein
MLDKWQWPNALKIAHSQQNVGARLRLKFHVAWSIFSQNFRPVNVTITTQL